MRIVVFTCCADLVNSPPFVCECSRMKRKRGRGFEFVNKNKRRKTNACSFVPVPTPRQSPVSVSFDLLLKYSTVRKKYKASYRSFASLPSIAEQLVEPQPEEKKGIVYSSSCRAYPLGYGRLTALAP